MIKSNLNQNSSDFSGDNFSDTSSNSFKSSSQNCSDFSDAALHSKTTNTQNFQDVIASIIHEFRDPLSGIIGLAELLKDEAKNSNISRDGLEYLGLINSSLSDLNDLVHDLLDVASGKSGEFSIDLSKEVNVEDLIKRVIRLNYSFSLRRKIKITADFKTDLNQIKLDAKRTKQILTNLISNAVKYSPENTEVKIIAEEKDNFLEIAVIDQGFGMSKEQAAKALEKYQTINNPNSGKVDSFGLGLPIVKELVERQGGQMEIQSEVGKGTKIRIRFLR